MANLNDTNLNSNPYYLQAMKDQEKADKEKARQENVAKQEDEPVKAKPKTTAKKKTGDKVPSVSESTSASASVQSDEVPDVKDEFDQRVLEGLSYMFKKKGKKVARTERVSVYLTKADKEAFTKTCKKLGQNCNSVLNDFVKAFVAANSN